MRAAASGRLPAVQLEISELVHPERLLSPAAVAQTTRKTVLRRTGVGCDLNRSMQHLHSSTREGGVENEAATKDLLQHRTKEPDLGSLAER